MKKRLLIVTVSLCMFAILIIVVAYLILFRHEPSHDERVKLLWVAAFQGRLHEVELMLAEHPELINSRKNGYALLHAAARSANLEVTELLLRHGADPNITSIETKSTPIIDCMFGASPGLSPRSLSRYRAEAALLIQYGAYLNPRSELDRTPILSASQSDVSMVRFLVEQGAIVPDTCLLTDGKTVGTMEDYARLVNNDEVADYFAEYYRMHSSKMKETTQEKSQ